MEILTERLILRPFEDGDLPAYSALNADPLVMQHYPNTYSTAQSAASIERCRASWDNNGFAFSAVLDRDTGSFLGLSGLSLFAADVPFAPAVEIGWRMVPSSWGKGLASEAARAWLAFGFKSKGLDEILAFTAHPNMPSQKVMQRIGMQRHSAYDFDMPSLPVGHVLRPHLVYRMTRAQFDQG